MWFNNFLKLIQPLPLKEPLFLDEQELSGMESLAKRHNLFPLLYVQLQRRYRNYSENKDIRSYLSQRKTLFLGNAARSMWQEVIEKEIVSLLYGEGIPAIVIKGNQIAKEIYNDPSCRNSSDIDMLIKLSDAIQTDQILTTAGYTRMDLNPLGFWFSRLHHAQYHYPQKNDLIEIHWNFGIPSFFNLLSEDIWNEVNYRDSRKVMMSPDMMVIQLLIHPALIVAHLRVAIPALLRVAIALNPHRQTAPAPNPVHPALLIAPTVPVLIHLTLPAPTVLIAPALIPVYPALPIVLTLQVLIVPALIPAYPALRIAPIVLIAPVLIAPLQIPVYQALLIVLIALHLTLPALKAHLVALLTPVHLKAVIVLIRLTLPALIVAPVTVAHLRAVYPVLLRVA